MRHFYTQPQYKEKWIEASDRIIPIQSTLTKRIIEKGILLPLKDGTDGEFVGGVVDSDGDFVAGVQRNRFVSNTNFSCTRAYPKPKNILYRPEKVVFGGILYAHWGHVILDSCTRLWYTVANPSCQYKYVFLTTPGTQFTHTRILDLAKIDYEIIGVPTQFSEVIVPDEGFFTNDSGNYTWLNFFNEITWKAFSYVNGLNEPIADKLYLTRTQLVNNDGVNEEYYETYFRDQGYKIYAPERDPLWKQIVTINRASKIVCTMGTLAHMLVFARGGIDVAILLRTPDAIMTAQLIINKLKDFNWQLIEATRNPLPVSQSNGAFFYAPTPYFTSWCADQGLEEPPDQYIHPELVVQYLTKWSQNYSRELCWRYIKDRKAVDFLAALHEFTTGATLDKEKYR